MAQGSKKGACSANVQPAKANCLQHNRRDANSTKVPSYVNPHDSHLNHTIFEDEMIKGRKSIVPLVKRAELLYTEKTGQKCQSSFVPFREDVLSLPGRGDITDEQVIAYLQQVEEKYHIKPIGAWYHKDEGHVHSKYIEGDENFEKNYHVHVLYSCQDQETGKAIRLPRSFYSLRQDFLSKATGLERGNPAAETRRERRNAAQQRIHAQEQRIAQLEQEAKAREQRIDGAAGKAKEIGAAAIEGLHNLLQPGKAKQERAAEIAAARADERAKVIEEVQRAAGLTLRDATAKGIGKSWGSWYSTAGQQAKDLKAAAAAIDGLKAEAKAAKEDAKGWEGRWYETHIDRVDALDKVKEQERELEAWRSGLLGRALGAIARFVKSLVYRLNPKERDDIAQAAAKISPHGLFVLAASQLPTESAKRAERAISEAIGGRREEKREEISQTNQTKPTMEQNELLTKLMQYAQDYAHGRKGEPWVRGAFNDYFTWHEEQVEAGRAMSFGGQSGSTHNREVMAEKVYLELRDTLDDGEAKRLRDTLRSIAQDPRQSRGLSR